ncbi:hypothetical protein SAMN04488122_4220 [Chitinophaga arvensicola]|uniref:Uncharacterized protein n=2 Tax=Chitinophaga arvensicola TaxID=29529 RepID=A0A1I0S706_9BACT|nr:hypothetical protein SAMN04488122_4220 [Chitinophaga arvensicola]
MMLHRIRKQTLLLTVHNKETVFTWQHQVTDLYWKKIIPALEQLFDSISTEDVVIYIDRLEIDLGKIEARDLENDQYVALLVAKVSEALFLLKIKGPSFKSLPEHAFDQWCYYMEQGALPWNAGRPDTAWYQQVLQTLATSYGAIAYLKKQLITSPDYLRRIVFQHPRAFLAQLLGTITAKNQVHWELLIQQLYEASGSLIFAKESLLTEGAFEQDCWQSLLLQAAEDPASSEVVFLHRLLITTAPVLLTDMDALQTLCGRKDWQKLRGVVSDYITTHPSALQKKVTTVTDIPEVLPNEKAIAETELQADTTEKNTFYVMHAGIILLHHWLSPLFRQLEWTDGKQFINAAARQKAILLLHYMATGQTEAEEFEIVLPKLLCGWPLKQPLDTRLTPDPAAMEEADGLLENAIQHWKILKNTSVDGLREGFLQRSGKLTMGEDKHQLQMESGVIDMLLDHLPWNISIIKLNWMKIPLHVQWR